MYFIIYMCHLHNEDLESSMSRKGTLEHAATGTDITQPPPDRQVDDSRGSNPLYRAAHQHELRARGMDPSTTEQELYDMVSTHSWLPNACAAARQLVVVTWPARVAT